MDSEKRQAAFLETVQRKVGFTQSEWKKTTLFGVSNRAILIEGGLQVGVGNADAWNSVPTGIIFASVLRFPPADEIYFALIIKNDCDNLIQRLRIMRETGTKQKAGITGLLRSEEEEIDNSTAHPDNMQYSSRNNLVGIYLADDGNIYLRNKGFWNSLDIDRHGLGPTVRVDQIIFAVYPPEPSAKRNLLVRDFVGYFVNLVGRNKVEEIQPWQNDISISPEMRRMPESIPLAAIEEGVKELGAYFTDGILERYHVALNHLSHKHFVILSGLSGTGKTSLAKFYALAVHGRSTSNSEDPFFFLCAVRPDWTDPTGLMGYHDVISGKYVVTPFLQAILIATAHKDTPVFVCIDEMNIARAEFYFADLLSAMESGMPLHLHSSSIPIDGSSGEQIPSEIRLPSNLFITGTINIDETTQPLSDKILDRANILDLSTVDMKGFLELLAQRFAHIKSSIEKCSPLLVELYYHLHHHNLGFGYRVAEECVRYCAFVEGKGGMSVEEALDSQVAQKILVKLRGGESQRSLLKHLKNILQSHPRSKKIVEALLVQLEEYGSFQYLR